ncbi:MAG: lipid-A-disaccharide synthase [Candidatus Accumulibacter sp.]|jgi:lipid-A-disaccharide synthase|nr:lipid-A-disaccharide synthase [Accumulibacter sp.]
MTSRGARIAMVAGEASGDLLAGHLIGALRGKLPNARFFGIGGPKMIRQGFETWHPLESLAVRGYAEVLRHYREIFGIRRDLKRRLLAEPPDLFIGVDAPDFNLTLERALKRRGVPTIHYVGPSIWAWRGRRIHSIGKSVSRILVLFPFEPALYEKENIPVTYVGHPLADLLPLEDARAPARELLGIAPQRPVFALLPGSRQSELEYMADTFIAAARLIHQSLPEALFLAPMATRETRLLFEAALRRGEAGELPIRLLFGHAHEAMAASDAVLAASGTATLEAALLKRPMVIAYRMAPLTCWLMRRMAYLPYVGLPNVLAGRFVVPEFLQEEATPENLARALLGFLSDQESRARIAEAFREIHLRLRQNTAEKAAEAVLALLPSEARKNAVPAAA